MEEVYSGEELGIQADDGKSRKVGRFNGSSSSARANVSLLGFLSSYMVCQRRTMPPSSVTWGRMEVMTSPPLRGDKPQACVRGQDMIETPCL